MEEIIMPGKLDDVEKSTTDNIEPETDEDDAWDGDYGLAISPNDFNVQTFVDYINRGKIKMPSFQRSYVWKKRQASKLIESLIRGLPVPQIFLYQDDDGSFLVIDGQQRLLSIYFFKNGRFPRESARGPLRRVFREKGRLKEEELADDEVFTDFKLNLHREFPPRHRLDGKKYLSLSEDEKDRLDLATFRTIIVKQLAPQNSSSAMYEIFARLNTGGTNLTAQEIRMSLYHGDFLRMVDEINIGTKWRSIFNVLQPDPRMRDIEILLRGFALLSSIANDSFEYSAPMTSFINKFCLQSRHFEEKITKLYKEIFEKFCNQIRVSRPFHNRGGKFIIASYDAVFCASCLKAFEEGDPDKVIAVKKEHIDALNENSTFQEAINSSTASEKNVRNRIGEAIKIICNKTGE